MLWLLLASLIWAFSFGLIKGLTSGLDPFLMGLIRMVFAFGISLFWYRGSFTESRKLTWLAIAGALQLGLMYVPYMVSFRYLKAHEVALFTMTTPIFVVAIHQWMERTFSAKMIFAAVLSILGGSIVAYKHSEFADSQLLLGILLVQLANVLFASGQYIYAKVAGRTFREQLQGAPFYFGGALIGSALVFSITQLNSPPFRAITYQEWAVLAWLGVVSSGLGFVLWNFGVSKVNYGTLAVASDFKLPVAILVSLVVFGEQANLLQLGLGMAILFGATVVVRPRKNRQ